MTLKKMLMGISIFLQSTILVSISQANSSPQNDEKFFSLTELKSQPIKRLRALEYISASDGTTLAFRSYLSREAKAVLIFYHGAGAHNGLSFHHIGEDLSTKFPISVFTPDIRGHGNSGGDRGDAPSVEQVWEDISALVEHARTKYPETPLYIGGHSEGAGLALNYSDYKEKSKIDGYVFLAPYFGNYSKTKHDISKERFEFTSVDTYPFIENAMSRGKLAGHTKAVFYNYPDTVLVENPKIVTFNTVNMSNAITPATPQYQFSRLENYGLWIGENDEAFDPIKVKKFADSNSDKSGRKLAEIIKDENHFSIILKGSELIGTWMMDSVK